MSQSWKLLAQSAYYVHRMYGKFHPFIHRIDSYRVIQGNYSRPSPGWQS